MTSSEIVAAFCVDVAHLKFQFPKKEIFPPFFPPFYPAFLLLFSISFLFWENYRIPRFQGVERATRVYLYLGSTPCSSPLNTASQDLGIFREKNENFQGQTSIPPSCPPNRDKSRGNDHLLYIGRDGFIPSHPILSLFPPFFPTPPRVEPYSWS